MEWNILQPNETAQLRIGSLLRLWVGAYVVSGSACFYCEVQNGSGEAIERHDNLETFEAAQQTAITQAKALLNDALTQLGGSSSKTSTTQ